MISIWQCNETGSATNKEEIDIDNSCEYNIMVSRKDPCKARLGLFEVLRVNLCSKANIIMRLFGCIVVICNFLMALAADLGLAALGAWIIKLGIYGIR